jgi:ketosteroid isomerase-like protein
MVSPQERSAQEGVLEDFLRHMSSHDFERLLSLFTDDVVYEDVARRAVRHGKDQVRAADFRLLAIMLAIMLGVLG